jgi:hypothetical protein
MALSRIGDLIGVRIPQTRQNIAKSSHVPRDWRDGSPEDAAFRQIQRGRLAQGLAEHGDDQE